MNTSSPRTLHDSSIDSPDAKYVQDNHWVKGDSGTAHLSEVPVPEKGSPREWIQVRNDYWIRRDSFSVPQSESPPVVHPSTRIIPQTIDNAETIAKPREHNNLRRRQQHQGSGSLEPEIRQVQRDVTYGSASKRINVPYPVQHQPSSYILPMRTFAAGVLLTMLGFAVWYLNRANALQGPFSDLHTFSQTELAKKRGGSVMDLPTESLSQYAQAACILAKDADGARLGLEQQLRGIPKAALDELLDRAVLPDVDTRSSMQNTTMGAGSDGKAFHYMAFWSTAAHTRGYSACVATAGVHLVIGEDVEEWRTTKTRRRVGDQPCHCGYLRCEKCPVFESDETRTPIYKRHRLTIRQQTELFHWMSNTVAERAGELAPSTPNSIASFFGFLATPKANAYIDVSNLKPVNPGTFMGRDDSQPAIPETVVEQNIE